MDLMTRRLLQVALEAHKRDKDMPSGPQGGKWETYAQAGHNLAKAIEHILREDKALTADLKALGLSPEVQDILRQIRAEVEGAYSDRIEALEAEVAKLKGQT